MEDNRIARNAGERTTKRRGRGFEDSRSEVKKSFGVSNEDDWNQESRTARKAGDRTVKRRGRDFEDSRSEVKRSFGVSNEDEWAPEPVRSVDGWVIFVGDVHEETTEDDLREKIEEFGQIVELHLPLNHRTGYPTGFAMVKYPTFEEAESAVGADVEVCGQKVKISWCFDKEPSKRNDRRRN